MWSYGRQVALGHALSEATPEAERKTLDWIDAIETHIRSGSQKELPRPRASARLDLAGVRRAAKVAELLIDSGGKGLLDTMERLLAHVSVSSDEEFIPFWERVLVPRHRFGKQDMTASLRVQLGTIYLIACSARGSVQARDAMLRVLADLDTADRGELMFNAALYGRLRDDLPPGDHGTWIDVVRRAAVADEDFAARYLARCALRFAGASLPEPDSGLFAFELRLGKFSCVIEVPADADLDDLHVAVRRALNWDNYHPWCFHLNGDRRNWRFTWPMADWLLRWTPPSLRGFVDDADGTGDGEADEHEDDAGDGEKDDDGRFDPQPTQLGALGLRQGNKLIYYGDFGTNELITLKLLRIDSSPKRSKKLPAISAKKGTRPKQYVRE